ncbi:ABC transporter ATP-binding protein [Zhengella mangrovi]|uniref:ABC transporter ATP-binding protein n=1 Tax=Zhengella mangrovi TaxID=1982044 RepID=A0A2G1QJW0_9HYPH|nr:ABC transporter ATP-binding protein [Zhengella mangrovi]PHP65782.1 ABC transporter ATP-binding protein [Zhengella mangrovi]
MTRMMEARGIHKSYGPVRVLEDVDFDLEAGEAHVVIGPNGAGKTTLFRCLSGESRIDGGTITLAGEDITGLAGWQRVKRGIGRSFQVARIFPDMSAFENLIVAIETRERVDKGLKSTFGLVAPRAAVRGEAEDLVVELGLEGRLDEPASTLSHGDKKRLELAMSLALKPKLLMLDEPTAGMSQSDRAEAVRLIAQVREKYGLTLLLTEHDMEVVFGLATRLTVLHHGAIIASGEPHKVRADARVREVYLGQH